MKEKAHTVPHAAFMARTHTVRGSRTSHVRPQDASGAQAVAAAVAVAVAVDDRERSARVFQRHRLSKTPHAGSCTHRMVCLSGITQHAC